MTGRRHRISALSSKAAIRPALSGKRPLASTSLSTILPHQQSISDSAQLRNDVEARLQAMKSSVDHEHTSTVKQIDGQCSKLKKRWKQDRQNLSTIAEAADTDWRNFLTDHEEDTREHQNSVEVLFSKLDACATQFTKTYVPELLKSVEMSMDAMKKHYARSAKSARRLSAREKMKAKLTDIKRKSNVFVSWMIDGVVLLSVFLVVHGASCRA